MKKITYVLRPYIHKSGRVMVRVRWNHSKNETVFSIGCSAEHEKWSKEANRAKNVHDVVAQVFYQFEVGEKNPSSDEFLITFFRQIMNVIIMVSVR